MSTIVFIFAPLVALLAYTVLGIGGFGSAIVSIPLLALLLPVKVVVPLVVLLDFCASLVLGLRLRENVVLPEVKTVLPGLLAGTLAGVTLLVLLPARAMLACLGFFILAYGIFSLVRRETRRRHSRTWGTVAGLIGGLVGGAFGTGGPLYVIYYSGRIDDPIRLRATLSLTFAVGSGFRIVLFALSGLLMQRQLWSVFALLLPMMLIGLWIGHRMGMRLPRRVLVRAVGALLIASGLSVLAKALGPA